jgi:hypothetical protein
MRKYRSTVDFGRAQEDGIFASGISARLRESQGLNGATNSVHIRSIHRASIRTTKFVAIEARECENCRTKYYYLLPKPVSEHLKFYFGNAKDVLRTSRTFVRNKIYPDGGLNRHEHRPFEAGMG